MNTVLCSKCNNHIQVLDASNSICIFCGNDITVNRTEAGYFALCVSECEKTLLDNNYSRAVELYDKYIEKFPNSSQLYWGRMLSRNRCKNDTELLVRGINIINDSDYVLAFHFASPEQKIYYGKIATIYKSIVADVINCLHKNEKIEKQNTDIKKIQTETLSDIDILQSEMVKKIKKLDEVEYRLKNKSIDSNVLINMAKTTIDTYVGLVEKIKNEVQSKSELEYAQSHEYKVQISRNSSICNQEWNYLQNFKSTALGKEYLTIVAEQNQAEKEVSAVMRKIEEVIKKMNDLIVNISLISNKYKDAIDEINNGSYEKANTLIGDDNLRSIVKKHLSH